MATFRPSCRANLQLRIDEGTDTETLRAELEQDSPTGATVQDTIPTTELGTQEELSRNRAERRLVTRERGNIGATELAERTSRLDTRRNAIQLGGANNQDKPQGIEGTTQDGRTLGIDLIPISASVMRNGLMEAGEATIVFDFRTAPIDPRVLRSVFLDLVIGTVSAEDFELGVLGGEIDGDPLSLVSRIDGQETRVGSTTRFVGFVDTWETIAGDDGDTIEVRARDMTAPLIDRKLPTGVNIDLKQPLADGVQALVDNFNATRGLKVIFGNPEPDGSGSDRGDRGPVPADTAPKTRKARRGKQSKRAKSGDQAMTVWDHIVDTVVAAGFLPIVRGMQLYLIEPRTFFAGTTGAKRMVYGHNLIELQFARKLGGVSKVPTIEVRCPDSDIGRTRWARAPVEKGQIASGIFGVTDPPKANRANNISPGGSPSEEIKVIPISGVNDGAALERIAQMLFEQIGRQETEGSFSTHDITTFGSEDEGDLLALQPGDPVEILIAPLNDATTGDSTNTEAGGSMTSLQELQTFTVGRRTEFLRSLGYPEAVARRLAIAQEQTNLQTTFRVQDVNIDWSQDDGVSVEVDFINFLVARESASAAKQAPSQAVLGTTAGSTSLASDRMEDASAAGNTLGAEAEAGDVSTDDYATRSTDDRGRQQRATQAQRRSG